MSKEMPKEFWVNVYEGNIVGWCKFNHRPMNLFAHSDVYRKVIYRIHVKMKENYKCQ